MRLPRMPGVRHDPKKQHRSSIRLAGYDYALPGAYFVTIYTRERRCVLDDPVVAGIVTDVWRALPGWFPTIELDAFVVMPNHLHLIVWLYGSDRVVETEATRAAPPASAIVRSDDRDAGAALAAAQQANIMGDRAGKSSAAGGEQSSPMDPEADVKAGGIRISVNPEPSEAPREWRIPVPTKANMIPTVGDVVGAFKSLVSKVFLDWCQEHDPTREAWSWQRGYFDHVVRSERSLERIRDYIINNPFLWDLDAENPEAGKPNGDAYYRAIWRQ